jgi:hypothetical protein
MQGRQRERRLRILSSKRKSEKISNEYQPTCVIQFRFRGHCGKVSVYYRKNENPLEIGWSISDFDLKQALGFPVIRAKVDYDGTGYSRMFGWTQIVTTESLSNGKKKVRFDPFPSTADLNLPFAPFGFVPEMFDAPITDDAAQRKHFKWFADTFLTSFPTRRNLSVLPILGFQWGYIFHDAPTVPSLLPLKKIGVHEWNTHLPLLRNKFKGWSFERATRTT